MDIPYFVLTLLIFLPGALNAQNAAESCGAPSLHDGFFLPKQEAYSIGSTLSYSCGNEHKPAVKGWWATSTCQNGEWSPKPQCIAKDACFPPEILNAKYTKGRNGWYERGHVIRISCDKGYVAEDLHVTAICVNGLWTSLPDCKRSSHTCGEPPQIPHALIIDQEYQEVFSAGSAVQYQCEDGYTVEGGGNKMSITCVEGNWTEGPTCRFSNSSRPDETEPRPAITAVSNCGVPPIVSNGEIIRHERLFLKYQCGFYYKRVGPDTVMCYTNGMWSPVPTCKAAFCSVDTALYPELEQIGVKYIKHDDTVRMQCVRQSAWLTDRYSVVRCSERGPTLSKCCGWFELKTNLC